MQSSHTGFLIDLAIASGVGSICLKPLPLGITSGGILVSGSMRIALVHIGQVVAGLPHTVHVKTRLSIVAFRPIVITLEVFCFALGIESCCMFLTITVNIVD